MSNRVWLPVLAIVVLQAALSVILFSAFNQWLPLVVLQVVAAAAIVIVCRRKSTAKELHALVDNAADVICAFDSNGRFVSVSDSARQVFGFEPRKLMGHWLIQHIPRDDIPRVTDLMLQAKIGNGTISIESGFVRADGLLIQVLWSFKWSDEQQRYVVIAHENTDKKRIEQLLMYSEAKIRSVLESLPVGVLTTDAEALVETANPAAEQLTGRSSEELIGSRVVDLIAGNRPELEKAFLDDTNHDGVVFQAQCSLRSGTPVEVIIKRFSEFDGKRFCVLIIDLSERVKIEKLRQEFVALVTHELRTPLTSLQALMTMLIEGVHGELPAKAQEKLEGAEQNVVRLMGLVNDILDMEKMEQGKFEFTFAETGLDAVIEKAVGCVKSFAEKQQISLKVESAGGVVFGDKDRLLQVLINLLSNAIKHSRPGDAISVIAGRQGDFVEVAIVDQGMGISPEHHQLIFERFQQVPGTRMKGTGLGLPLCKTIVEKHGGQIGLESTTGQGSRFWFTIPALKVESPLA